MQRRNLLYKICFCLYIACSAFRLSSQDLDPGIASINTLTADKGLKIQTIYSLRFDKKGWLWIAGAYSVTNQYFASAKKLVLQRYNGHSFTDVEIPGQDSIVANTATMFPRSDGKFYISVTNADGSRIILFDPVSLKMEYLPKPPGITEERDLELLHEYEGQLYAYYAVKDSIKIYRLGINQPLTHLVSFPGFAAGNSFITGIAVFSDHILFSTTLEGIRAVGFDGNIRYINGKRSLSIPLPYNLHFDNPYKLHDSTFVLMNNAVYYYNPRFKTFHRQPGEAPHTILNPDNFRVYLSTYTDRENKNVFFHIKPGGIIAEYLNEKERYKVHIPIATELKVVISNDINTDLWLAEEGKLHHVILKNRKIKYFLKDKSIRSVLPTDDKDKYIVGTEFDGLYEIDIKQEKSTPYLLSRNGKPMKPIIIRGLFQDKDDIWMAHDYSITRISKKNRQAESWSATFLECIGRLPDGNIITGTKKNKLYVFDRNLYRYNVLASTDTFWHYDIRTDQAGYTYIATDKGIVRYSYSETGFKYYNKAEGLTDPFIMSIELTKNYGLIAGSKSGKLYRFNASEQRFELICSDVFNASIVGITEDRQGTIWLNTFNGVISVNMATKAMQHFTTNSGLCYNEGNRYSMLLTSEGGIFAGTLKGLNYFMPGDLGKTKDNVEVELISMQLPGSNGIVQHEQNLDILSNISTLTLPAENRSIFMEFAIHAVLDGYDLRYQYSLDEGAWIDLGKQNYLRFSNLAPGRYILKIRATEPSGEPTGKILSLNIEAKDFFYKAGWFHAMVIGMIILLSLYLINQYRKRQKQQVEFTHKLIRTQEEERFRISRDLHDSVGQHLILIKNKARQNSQAELEDIASSTLNDIRSITRSLHPFILKQFGISEALKRLVQTVDESSGIFFSVDIEDISGIFDEETELNIYRIVQEVLNNLVKHSGSPSAELTLVKQNRQVLISIRDHGKGFSFKDAALMQQSLGMKTMQERSDMIHAQLKINSVPGQGTTTELIIPIA